MLGSGRAELCEAIYGLRPIDRGTLSLKGAPTDLNEPKASLASGVFLLPEDRKSEGVFGHLDVRENVVLGYNPATDPAAVKIASRATNRSSWRLAGAAAIPVHAERRAFDAMRAALRDQMLARPPTFRTSAEAISRRRFSLAVHCRIPTCSFFLNLHAVSMLVRKKRSIQPSIPSQLAASPSSWPPRRSASSFAWQVASMC